MSHFVLIPEMATRIRWNRLGSCGEAGCTDAICACSLCGKPIGTPESDPRWNAHDDYCGDCELCQDQVPAMLFRGEGKAMESAQFHWLCFTSLIASPAPVPAMHSVQ